MLSKSLADFTTVVAKKQLKGRGQRGASWYSEEGKNLTFSVLKKANGLKISNPFLLNIYISVALYTALKKYNVPNLAIKWPNDILSAKQKICGILIENVLLGQDIQAVIIGIGLNVNQTSFQNLPRASSLKLILGKFIDPDELLQNILWEFQQSFKAFNLLHHHKMRVAYTDVLFRKDKPSTFKDADGRQFMGFIKGVSEIGKLQLLLEDEETAEFNLKEIELLY